MSTTIECPSCHRKLAGRPKFCTFCRHRIKQPHGVLFKVSVPMFGFGLFLFIWFMVSTYFHRGVSASNETTAASLTSAHAGDTTTVREGGGVWPCGSTAAALQEMTKWAARGDKAEVFRTMRTTGSIGLLGGMSVKILDGSVLGYERQVRVLTGSDGSAIHTDAEGTYSDPRVGRECWVVSEALK